MEHCDKTFQLNHRYNACERGVKERIVDMVMNGSGVQDMLDYCGEHNIVCDSEMIPIQQINQAYERMLKGDLKYRFVIDSQSLKNPVD